MEMTVYFDPPIDDPNDIPKVLEWCGKEWEVLDYSRRVSKAIVSDACLGASNVLSVSGGVHHGWVLVVRPIREFLSEIVAE